jgi:hypothetical protein
MANPTTNYGFVMPTSTDLVTDLPADFGVFGQAVDTQMLTNANAAIAKTIVDAKGDIIAATAADTVSRLAVGANGTVLTADSTAATGIKWATTGASGKVLQVVQATTATSVNITTTTFTDTGLSGTITPTSSTSKVLVMTMQGYKAASGGAGCNAGISLVRGATDILVMGSNGVALGANATGSTSVGVRGIASLHYLDSPATTSATTYKTQGRLQTSGGGNEIEFQVAGLMTSTIILMEIGA